jgi:glycosyltransferase involved in cell wall biosynthesis
MKVSLVFPVLPPALDGIGAYTARLAESLIPEVDVKIITAAENVSVSSGVEVEKGAFSIDTPLGIRELKRWVCAATPDWLILQYNPFSYGTWGFAPVLPRVLHQLKAELPDLRIGLMVHEPFVPIESVKWAVMSTWQRWQLWKLGQAADQIFFSTEPWTDRFQSWFPTTPVQYLPVGSNIPNIGADYTEERARLGFNSSDLVVGIFGSGHFSRLLHFVRAAVNTLSSHHPNPQILYVGPAGNKVRKALPNSTLYDAGTLSDEEVSRHFATMDLYLAPFRKGASSRRGSLHVGLQHGIPTVSTYGIHTGPVFYRSSEDSLLLAPEDRPDIYAHQVVRLCSDPELRSRIGRCGRQFYEECFDWDVIVQRLLAFLSGDIAFSFTRNVPRSTSRLYATVPPRRSI